MKKKRWLVGILLGVLVVALLPLTASLVDLRGSVARAFEDQWGRPVELSRVEARLLPEPGLRGYGVKIGEAEAFGAEPFVQAEEVDCRLQLRPLLRGRVECARIHLVRPSLNLVRNHEGAWNLAQWAQRGGVAWPVLSAEEARINVKQGTEKKVYALTDTRFVLETRPDAWQLSLEAHPFRSDRQLAEIGSIKLIASLGRVADTASVPVDVSWEFERGSLSQWYAFATGRDLPLRADVALRGRVTGTWRELLLAGEFTLEDLHRWDLIPGRPLPRWRGQYEFRFFGLAHDLEIVRAELRSEHSAVGVRGRIGAVFGKTDWDVEVAAPALALDELLAQYSALKANVSPATRLEGAARFTAKLAGPTSRWKAALALEKAGRWRLSGLRESVRVEPFELRWEQGRLELRPLRFVFPGERSLEVSGRLVPQGASWLARIEAHAPELELEYAVAAARALGWDLWGETRWQGRAQVALEWRSDARAWQEWRCRGILELHGMSFQPRALNRALRIEAARVEYAGRAIRVMPLTVQLAEATLTGTLERARPEAPWLMNLSVDRLTLNELDALVNPERARDLLGALMGSPTPSTEAWDPLQAKGRVEVESLQAGPFHLAQFQADAEWRQRRLLLTQLRFRSLGGQFRGSLQGDFRARLPAYRLAGNAKQIDLNQLLRAGTRLGEFFSGNLGADVMLQTAGRGSRDLRRNLQGIVAGVVTDGTLRNINLLGAMRAAAGMPPEETDAQPRTALQSLGGEFHLANRRVRCQRAQMVVDGAALELSGEVDFEGRLNLRLRGEPLLVAGVEPTPAHRQLFTSGFEIRGHLREPVVRLGARPR